MTQNPTILSAIALLNQSKQVLRPSTIRAKGTNFMTPVALGTWKIRGTPIAIEISEGVYPNGETMYGLTVFDVTNTAMATDLSKACSKDTLVESLQDIINRIYYQQRKLPNA